MKKGTGIGCGLSGATPGFRSAIISLALVLGWTSGGLAQSTPPAPPLAADAPAPQADTTPAPKDPWKAWALGRFDRALEGFLDRQIARPDDAAALRNVGAARYRLGDFAGAAEAYAASAEKAADPALRERALYDLGNAAYRQGQLEEAVKAYEAALAIDPEDEDARYNLEFVREEIRRRLEEAQNREQQQDPQQQQQEQQDEQQEQESEPQPQPGDQDEQPPQPEPQEPEAGEEEGEPQPQPSGEPQEQELSPEEVEALLRSLEEGRPAETAPPRPSRRGRPAKDW